MAQLLSGSDEATMINKRNAMAKPEPTQGHGRILGNIDATNIPRRGGRRGNSLIENQPQQPGGHFEQNRENYLPSLGHGNAISQSAKFLPTGLDRNHSQKNE